MNTDWLDDVETIYAHKDCPDGIASAILLNDAFDGKVPIIFVDHVMLKMLAPTPRALFVDIAPPRETAESWRKHEAIVLDHHEKQRDVVAMFGERGVFADIEKEPGVSGAMLAFREVWQLGTTGNSPSWLRAHAFASVAGIRDTWQTKNPLWREARIQAEALRFFPWATFKEIRSPFGESGFSALTKMLDQVGQVLVKRSDARAVEHVETAYGFKTAKGTRVVVIASTETSDVAELVGEQADLVIGFRYVSDPETARLQFSLRSHGAFDAGAFAVALGGGGHRAAAGASTRVGRNDLNPFATIEIFLGQFESVGRVESARP